MTLDPLSDAKIVDSWHRNAEPWTAAVRESRIESRTLVTNHAIVDAVLSRRPKSVLDIGCGEGWLVRALAERDIRAIGVDIVPDLVDKATRAGGGEFRVASYETIAAGQLDVPPVDVVVANFSLLGKESVDDVIRRTPALLHPQGALIVQTLHPLVACGDLPYVDGWRPGSWSLPNAGFCDPAPWYFRTIESWVRLVVASGFRVVEIREPLHPTSQKPASVVFIAAQSG
jgi:2-polyprenyl-3-methyl-5-hydroxy-6-metoxy-1,4-benzoquinol methylase